MSVLILVVIGVACILWIARTSNRSGRTGGTSSYTSDTWYGDSSTGTNASFCGSDDTRADNANDCDTTDGNDDSGSDSCDAGGDSGGSDGGGDGGSSSD